MDCLSENRQIFQPSTEFQNRDIKFFDSMKVDIEHTCYDPLFQAFVCLSEHTDGGLVTRDSPPSKSLKINECRHENSFKLL